MELKYECSKDKIGVDVDNHCYIHYTKCRFDKTKYTKNGIRSADFSIFLRESMMDRLNND